MLIFKHIGQDPLIVMSSLESKSTEQAPKRTLNPIIKAMNDYRNNVIGEHIGSKAPKRTAPVFKVTLEAARSEMGIEEGSKNTIEIVDKASELFSANPEKYVKLAEKVENNEKQTETKKSKDKKIIKKQKEVKSSEEESSSNVKKKETKQKEDKDSEVESSSTIKKKETKKKDSKKKESKKKETKSSDEES